MKLSAWSSIFVSAQDGLRLHVREYGARTAPGLTVVCLPGLARTAADFDALAPVLAYDGGNERRVIAIDSRGRGQSEYDKNPENYNLAVELGDVVAVLIARGISKAVFIGSSRGGMLAMLLGVAHPTVVAGVVLHDIGPVIEPRGVARIKGYVGKLPQPRNYAEGVEILRRLMSAHFPKLSPEQWLGLAQRTWRDRDGELVPSYDVNLSRTLADVDIEHPLPPLWNEFDALAPRLPLMVIRGANSDILSPETVTQMQAHHPDMEVVEVADQGHVPLLEGDELIHRIAQFVATCEGAENGQKSSPLRAAAAPL